MSNWTRRDWLQSAALATVGGMLGDASNGAENEVEIIDCHTHFYDPTRPEGVPWPGKGDSLHRRALPEDFRKVVAPANVVGTVVVEASPWVEDNQWLLDLAEKDRFVVGVVGNLDPAVPEFAGRLQRFAKNRRFRGFRINHDSLRKGLEKDDYKANLKRTAEANLELDVNGGPDTPATVARLAAELPDLRIVINHVGNVRIDGGPVPEAWLAGIKQAANHPRVFCKVSALVEGAVRPAGKPAPSDLRFYRPVLNAVWEAFGEDRLIFGSNWPVSERAAGFATLLQIVCEFFMEKGPSATAKFFLKNSLAAYQWPSRK